MAKGYGCPTGAHPGGAYEIVKRLEEQNEAAILLQLSEAVTNLIKITEKNTRYLSRHLIVRE